MAESITPEPVQEPVSVDDNAGSLTVDGTVTANLAAGTNNIGDVDVLSVPAPLSTTGGGTEATALRVTVASDSTGVVSVDDNGASLTVDGTVTTTPSGDHTVIGKAADGAAVSGNPVLVAGQDGTNVQSIHTDTDGDLQVDVLTVPAPLSTTGGGTEAAALRVTIANDSTGVLSIDDNGGSITVDGTVTATSSGDYTVIGKAADGAAVSGNPVLIAGQDGTNVQSIKTDTAGELQIDVLTVPAPLSTTGGGTEATALRVTVASDSTGVLSVDDNGGALTVDQATAANLNATVVQGAAGTAWEVVGDVANDIGVPANPVVTGGRASTAVPTAVNADGDAVYEWLTRNGAPVVTMAPHVGIYRSTPWNLVSETAQYTTTQTSTVLVAGGASEGLVVTYIQIQAGGTTAGTVQVYFGTGAYSRGTNYAIFDGEFAPSATLKPGFVANGPFISAANGDDILVTTSAAINPLTITVWYYVVT